MSIGCRYSLRARGHAAAIACPIRAMVTCASLSISHRHLEYALTWFGLAAALVGVWLAYVLRKPRPE